MSGLRVSTLRGATAGSSPTLPDGVIVTGVTTATSFAGALTGNVTGNVVGNVTGDVTGNIAGTAGTFSGNVSVGGTLTYEDVTNIDSVGIITARSGIKIGVGQSISAVSGIITYYGDGSQLSGVESGVSNFVASGTIPNGATVVVKTDGTVGIVTLSTSNTPSAGTPTTFNTGNTNLPYVTYDSTSEKIIIVYSDDGNSGKGTAIVGTVSGTSISFGSEIIFNNAITPYVAVAHNSTNDKIVIAYRDQGSNSDGTAVVGTVSGTSISFGTPVVFKSGQANYISMTSGQSPNGDKVAITYQNGTGGDVGECVIGTISGTSISFGTPVGYESNRVSASETVYDTQNGRVVIFYRDVDNTEVKGIVGNISSNSISFGSASIAASTGQSVTLAFCGSDGSGNGLVFAAWNDNVGSGRAQASIGTVNGSSISWGSISKFGSAAAYGYAAEYSTTDSKVILSYGDYSTSTGDIVLGTINGTNVSFGSTVTYRSEYPRNPKSAYDSTNNKAVVVAKDLVNTVGDASVISATSQTTNLTAENYIGIAAEAISNGATGKINILGGTNTGQTGLTTAQTYYVQTNGTLATSAGSPSVVAGDSISDTKILIR